MNGFPHDMSLKVKKKFMPCNGPCLKPPFITEVTILSGHYFINALKFSLKKLLSVIAGPFNKWGDIDI